MSRVAIILVRRVVGHLVSIRGSKKASHNLLTCNLACHGAGGPKRVPCGLLSLAFGKATQKSSQFKGREGLPANTCA